MHSDLYSGILLHGQCPSILNSSAESFAVLNKNSVLLTLCWMLCSEVRNYRPRFADSFDADELLLSLIN